MAPYAIDAKILNDQGSPSRNTTTGKSHSSFILFRMRLVERAGWPLRCNKPQRNSSSNPFSTSLSNIPPVSMAMINSISCSMSSIFSFSTLYGTPYPESPTSSLALMRIQSPRRFRSWTVRLPIIRAPSSSGLNLKSSRMHRVITSRSSARLFDSF